MANPAFCRSRCGWDLQSIELRGSKFSAKPFHLYPLISRLFATEPQPRPWLCASGKDALFVLLTESVNVRMVS